MKTAVVQWPRERKQATPSPSDLPPQFRFGYFTGRRRGENGHSSCVLPWPVAIGGSGKWDETRRRRRGIKPTPAARAATGDRRGQRIEDSRGKLQATDKDDPTETATTRRDVDHGLSSPKCLPIPLGTGGISVSQLRCTPFPLLPWHSGWTRPILLVFLTFVVLV